MSIFNFEGIHPKIADSTFIDTSAVIIGSVTIGEHSSVWPMTVIRGDVNSITIGDRTSIQDNTVIHVSHAGTFNPTGNWVQVGNEVTVGHRVILHGCTIGNRCLIGMGSLVMDGVVIEDEVMLGAGSLVSPGKVLESGYLWLGSPAKKIRPLSAEEKSFLIYNADHYVKLAQRHMNRMPQGDGNTTVI